MVTIPAATNTTTQTTPHRGAEGERSIAPSSQENARQNTPASFKKLVGDKKTQLSSSNETDALPSDAIAMNATADTRVPPLITALPLTPHHPSDGTFHTPTSSLGNMTLATQSRTAPHGAMQAQAPLSEPRGNPLLETRGSTRDQSIGQQAHATALAHSRLSTSTLGNDIPSLLTAASAPSSPSAAHSPVPSAVNSNTETSTAQWANVRIDTQAGKWGEQMLQVLHDRVTLQSQQNLQEARIRLDPPDLGKLDLTVRVEGDRLSVQINANAAATREALMQVSDRLRNELQQQNILQVEVQVGSGDNPNPSSNTPNHDEEAGIFAARERNEQPTSFSSHSSSDHWFNIHA
ncbi:flagellar hook-length control protein FliK [Vibrio methylphosphonaticus]|uniref:flagellar hook-length control protein FliK n=1 Tax=Vibrio methylphosphonaticus TaxID=2946866 RepID=UPI00202AAB06|nr:flagellar hook-length control protein FliK [Vibrio methylphosphonaticus]MCL9776512.1 flagellar hook-length control protein FliK [Vibrio methylphosphonaticus]